MKQARHKLSINAYLYATNGNLTKDLNKNITDIKYSWNNLPKHILLAQDNQNTIDYLYNAAGTKLCKVTSSDRAAGLTTDYSGPFVYEDSKLSFIQTSEGRIVPGQDAYAYEYFLRVEAKRKSRNLGNHLGNTRVVFNEQGEVLQVEAKRKSRHFGDNSYYPFGGIMEGLNYTADLRPENKFLYNGKEMQDDFGLDWYDYGARFYDAQLGRWHVVDPSAENYYEWSPYHYVANNPINLIDPNGMDWYEDKDGNTIWREGSEEIEGYTNIGENYSMDIGGGKIIQFKQSNGYLLTNTNTEETEDLSINTGKEQEFKEALKIASNLLTPGLTKRDVLSPLVVAFEIFYQTDPQDIDQGKAINYSMKLALANLSLEEKRNNLGNEAANIVDQMEKYDKSAMSSIDYQKLKYKLIDLEKKLNRLQSDLRHIKREERRVNSSLEKSTIPVLMEM